MPPVIDPRAAHLLKTLVERYIAEGQPVGSRALSRQSGLDLSPATIRNVMADLEEMGFVASPHTSAGRVPTETGYRYYAERLILGRSPASSLPLEPVAVFTSPDGQQVLAVLEEPTGAEA